MDWNGVGIVVLVFLGFWQVQKWFEHVYKRLGDMEVRLDKRMREYTGAVEAAVWDVSEGKKRSG